MNNDKLCPTETALELIGGKWKGMILYHLLDGTKRFNELRRLMPEVTQRMLTKQLRDLEQSGVVYREVYPEVPPKVEYSLTELGKDLEIILRGLESWGTQYLAQTLGAASLTGHYSPNIGHCNHRHLGE